MRRRRTRVVLWGGRPDRDRQFGSSADQFAVWRDAMRARGFSVFSGSGGNHHDHVHFSSHSLRYDVSVEVGNVHP